MNIEIMRKHYERTPKETLINVLVASREQVEKLQQRNKKLKERIDKAIEILDIYGTSNYETADLLYSALRGSDNDK